MAYDLALITLGEPPANFPLEHYRTNPAALAQSVTAIAARITVSRHHDMPAGVIP
jgi:hypothetical protein